MAKLIDRRTQEPEGDERSRLSLAWLLGATAVAAVVATVATAILYFVASAARVVDDHVVLPSLIGMGPLSLASVALTAIVAIAGAGALLGVLAATTRRPVRIFRIAATALAVASLSLPATIPGPPAAMRLTMAGMHLVVWAVSVGVLATLASRRVKGAA